MKKIIILLIVAFLLVKFVSADPLNKTQVEAEGGNITQLIIYDDAVNTHYWQGYYGNISGSISLSNTNNFSLYSWDGIANPSGEIYAANDSISDWSNILCLNISSNYPGYNCKGEGEQCLNISELEASYSMSSTDADGVNETFNTTMTSIMVGTKTLYNCPMVNLFTNSSYQAEPTWNETILTINDTETVIYASIINANQYGYDNQTWDFQMIVADYDLDSNPTTYYIYTELV